MFSPKKKEKEMGYAPFGLEEALLVLDMYCASDLVKYINLLECLT